MNQTPLQRILTNLQGTTPQERLSSYLQQVQRQYHMAAQEGPQQFAEWDQTFTGGIDQSINTIFGTATGQTTGAGAGRQG
jgi:hypothetical protein